MATAVSRNYSLDFIRILACAMVVLMHSPMPSSNANGAFLTALSYFTAPCIGLFFMTSGALLLPVRIGVKDFIVRRLSKIVVPTVVWSIIYLFLNGMGVGDVLGSLYKIPFGPQGTPVLWFMYTLTGLYLLAPVLSPWLENASRRELEFYLGISALTFALPYLSSLVAVNLSNTGMLFYFSGYVGYFVLGCYLKRYGCSNLLYWLSLMVGFGTAFLILAFKIVEAEYDFYSNFWYLNLPVAAMCVTWFASFQKAENRIAHLSDRIKGLVAKLSSLSFGIFLCHIAVMRYFLWNLEVIQSISNYILQCVTVFVATMVLSLALTYLISLTPVSKNLIGVK